MNVSVMQPYLFPYIGYFDLIYKTDLFVSLDIVQYIKGGWINRNRILHPLKGWQYITVPVQKITSNTKIKDVEIVDKKKAHQKLSGQISHYKKHAPFFKEVRDIVNQCFEFTTTNRIADLATTSLQCVCTYLNIPFNLVSIDELPNKESLSSIDDPGIWSLEITHMLKGKKYINLPGGRELFNPVLFEERGIKIEFIKVGGFTYECSPFVHEDRLSILDVLAWNSPEVIVNFLKSRECAPY